MASQPLPLPDFCHVHHDWSPIAAAPNQSAMAAVLAGFVFGSIVVLLSVRATGAQDDAGRALRLLFTAFFGLAVTAYLFADLAGEQTCLRAETEEVLAGGMLGTFAIVMMVSLTWLVVAYRQDGYKVLEFLRGLIYFASAFVVLLLSTSSESYLSAVLQYGSHTAVNILIYATGGVSVATPGLWFLLRSRRRRLNRTPEQPPEQRTSGKVPAEPDSTASDTTVNMCAWAALGYLALSSLTAGVALSIPARWWYPTPAPWTTYAAAWTALLLPLGVLGFAIRALARHREPSQRTLNPDSRTITPPP